jgi:hypothetical protein
MQKKEDMDNKDPCLHKYHIVIQEANGICQAHS